jgi:hypothetical protein
VLLTVIFAFKSTKSPCFVLLTVIFAFKSTKKALFVLLVVCEIVYSFAKG